MLSTHSEKFLHDGGMSLKQRIREAMDGAGLKPLQLANATGVSSGAVTHWLDGATKSLKAAAASELRATHDGLISIRELSRFAYTCFSLSLHNVKQLGVFPSL